MKESSKKSDKQSSTWAITLPDEYPVNRRKVLDAAATRTRSQYQTHMISLRYLKDIRYSLTRFYGPTQCWLTKIIKPNIPRENHPKMIEAKFAEISDLINRGTFRAILRIEVPDGANMITARKVFSTKSDQDKKRYKASYVAGGYLDIMKDYKVHGTQTIQCASACIILIVAKINGFRIW